VRTVNIDLPWASRIRLVNLGDAHVGHVNCREDLLKDVVSLVMADENAYIIDYGDAIDAINLQDKRFTPSELASWMTVADLSDIAKAEVARYVSFLKPAADAGRILARLKGNHEDVLSKIFERDVYNEINDALSLPQDRRLGVDGFVRLHIADNQQPSLTTKRKSATRTGSKQAWTVTAYIHHGYVGGRLSGAKALALQRLPSAFRADIYAMAHSHDKITLAKQMVTADGPQQIVMLNTGSFLDTYSDGTETYGERKGMYPAELGPVEVWLYPDTRKMKMVT